MPLNETIETFRYLLREAEKLDLAYFCFLRYTEDFDAVIDGWVFYLVLIRPTYLMVLYRQTSRDQARCPRYVPSVHQNYAHLPQW